jgi:signal transduction histidine kinase
VSYEMKATYSAIGEREVSASYFPIEGPAGIDRAACVLRDITERKRDEQALRNYSRRLIEAQETERHNIARELHDQIGQVLTAVQLNLQNVLKSCESSDSRTLIEEGITIVDEAVVQVRDLSFELRPALLDDLGLITALRWYTDRFAQRTGILATAAFDPPQIPTRLKRELETACFRIVQEALRNVLRHAKASRVLISLKNCGGQILLVVKDDGTGFDVHSENFTTFTNRVGLRGMKERTMAVGGRLEVRSSPSQGTEIRAQFPYDYATSV